MKAIKHFGIDNFKKSTTPLPLKKVGGSFYLEDKK
jgi:hypothetical protein